MLIDNEILLKQKKRKGKNCGFLVELNIKWFWFAECIFNLTWLRLQEIEKIECFIIFNMQKCPKR